MSSFSSVIQKPGKRIVPKAAPRRNIVRKHVQAPTPASSASEAEDQVTGQSTRQSNKLPPLGNEEYGNHALTPTDPGRTIELAELETNPRATVIETRSENENALPKQNSDLSTSAQMEQTVATDKLTDANTGSTALPTQAEGYNDRSEQGMDDERLLDTNIESIAIDTEERVQQPPAPTSTATRSLRKRVAPSGTVSQKTSRKRLKTISTVPPQLTSARGRVTVPVAQSPPQQLTVASLSSARDPLPADLLQSATQRAASVSELANNIQSQLRSSQMRAEPNSADELGLNLETEDPDRSTVRSARTRRKKTLQQQAAEVVANAIGNQGDSARQRGKTPDDAEDYELEPAKITMGDLCEDKKLGKKSNLESEMQANWSEILQRRREDRERALANAEKRRRKGVGQKNLLDASQQPVAALAPAMTVVNGVIVVDQASREIDRAAQLQQAAAKDLGNVREDKDYYKYVNQGTVGVKPGHGHHARWDEESTDLFFKGLRMFGTDFLMIANMFPGLTRKQIKTKFIREENTNKSRILECLRNREPVQLEDYAEMANKQSEEFHTLDSIQKELDEQEKRLRDEDNQRRKREGFATTGEGENAPQAVTEGDENTSNRQTESAEPGRFDAITREIVEAAGAPKRRQRKANTANSRRGAKGNRRPEGGIEEVLGSISEVAV